jgi:hypothetical protein
VYRRGGRSATSGALRGCSIPPGDAEGVEDCEGLVQRGRLGFVADRDVCIELSSSVCEGDEAIDEGGWLVEALSGFARQAVVESERPEASPKADRLAGALLEGDDSIVGAQVLEGAGRKLGAAGYRGARWKRCERDELDGIG